MNPLQWAYPVRPYEIHYSSGNYASFYNCSSSANSPVAEVGHAIKLLFGNEDPTTRALLKAEASNFGSSVTLKLSFTISTATSSNFSIYASTTNTVNYSSASSDSYTLVGSFNGGGGASKSVPLTIPAAIKTTMSNDGDLFLIIVPEAAGSTISIKCRNSGSSMDITKEPQLRLESSERRVDIPLFEIYHSPYGTPSTSFPSRTTSSEVYSNFILCSMPTTMVEPRGMLEEILINSDIAYLSNSSTTKIHLWLVNTPYFSPSSLVNGSVGHFLGSFRPMNPSSYDSWFSFGILPTNTAAINYMLGSSSYLGLVISSKDDGVSYYNSLGIANYNHSEPDKRPNMYVKTRWPIALGVGSTVQYPHSIYVGDGGTVKKINGSIALGIGANKVTIKKNQ